jgi:uncharacterized SAM-binding protein YcdF (DUF218 family)
MTNPPRQPSLRLWVWTISMLIGLWLAGLVAFATDIPDRLEDSTTHTDAIVVLTGGSGRLETGLALLRQGLGDKLFVSGVYRGIDVNELLRLSRQKPDPMECCIILGHSADNTLGNAAETAQWMKQQGLHSLRLVTGNYHMRRSLSEFHAALPDALIIAHPVFPDAVKRDHWWLWPGTAHLIVGEYSKFLLGEARHWILSQGTSL